MNVEIKFRDGAVDRVHKVKSWKNTHLGLTITHESGNVRFYSNLVIHSFVVFT